MMNSKKYAGWYEPKDLWITYKNELLPVAEVIRRIFEEEDEED